MDIKIKNWKTLLIRSTFKLGRTELPQDTRSFLKMILLSILVLPVSWITHMLNLIARDFIFEWTRGLYVYLVGIVFSSLIIQFMGVNDEFVRLSVSDKLWNMYTAAPVNACIVAMLCINAIIIFVIISSIYEYICSRYIMSHIHEKYATESTSVEYKQPSFIGSIYKSIKNKYSEKINYIN